ncbi:glycosyltransferase, partial [Variovorax sp. YR752]|uniref:glycosyltransferase n=1 Tax=Variovorax sp. YR752 TaxID=1884383 RepID=UPI003137F66B
DGLHAVLDGGPETVCRIDAARERARALCDGQSVVAAYETAYRRAQAAAVPGPAAATVPTVPLRVMHVLNELMPSGAEVMLRTSADHWPQHGVQCQLLSLGAEPGPYAAPLRKAGYALHHLPFEPSLRFVRRFQERLRAEGVDVVHLHVERASMWLALAVRLAGVRCVVRTVHNNFLFHGGLRLRRVVSRAVMRLLGTRQIAISEMVRETERERFGNPSMVIHNWYDSARIVPVADAQRHQARHRLGIADPCFVVLTIGNCSAVKNHASLIEALAQLDRTDWCYLHIGCEEPGHPERALAEQLGVADRIRFLGLQQDVSPYLQAADLYAMPSRREGLSIASLEAIGAGLPSLLGDVPGLRDLQSHFSSVRLSAVDAGSLAAALRSAMSAAPEGLRTAAHADAALARERFGVERGVAAYVRVYGKRLRPAPTEPPPPHPDPAHSALPAG